ncbi:MAG: MFS transporter [Clostridiales bacterium]|nr:MFS transporter [Clostridiales bacterium]
MNSKGFLNKIKGGLSYVKAHWSSPAEGKYLSFKEFAAFSAGGIGAYGAIVLSGYLTLSAGYYLAAALNIDSFDIWLISTITSVITILRAPLIGKIVDNTNGKYGKFRPYLMIMPLPILLLTAATVFITPAFSSNYTAMLVVFTVLFNLQQIAVALYNLAFTTLAQVVSPSQTERETLMGVGASIYSLGASAVNFLFPLVANIIFGVRAAGGGMTTPGINRLGTFQWILPVMLIVFFALGYVMAFGTKERAVTAKNYSNRVGLKRGFKETAKNKYFWLNQLSGALGFAKLYLTGFVTVWICNYMLNTEWAQSVVTTVIGLSYTPAMLGAPFLLKKFGKKKLVIASNLICGALAVPMAFSVGRVSAYFLVGAIFVITFFNAIQIVTAPALSSQINDYQQFKTGERMEGSINQFGTVIGTALGVAFALIPSVIYHAFGFFDDPSVLLDTAVLYPILRVSVGVAAASSVAAAIPMFFWDLSEKKHEKIMEILKIRAALSDGETDAGTAEKKERELLNEYEKA